MEPIELLKSELKRYKKLLDNRPNGAFSDSYRKWISKYERDIEVLKMHKLHRMIKESQTPEN